MRLQLRSLAALVQKYVPAASLHGNYSFRASDPSWWPAHELGHLLTVPRAWVGLPSFNLQLDGCERFHADFPRQASYEVAACSVSWRLLRLCGRADLIVEEQNGTDTAPFDYHNRAYTRRILRRTHCLRLPGTRDGLERKICARLGL